MQLLQSFLKIVLIVGLFSLFIGCGGSSSGTVTHGDPVIYAIGDKGPAGGIVFYITEGGLHGLEAAPQDQLGPHGGYAIWGCQGEATATGALGVAVGTGSQNTAEILAFCADPDIIAAVLTELYTLNGHVDWFLPSKDELNLLYLQKDVVGGFDISTPYWTSSALDISTAWMQHFRAGANGAQVHFTKHSALAVRAIRAF